jgi:hypothetical protein
MYRKWFSIAALVASATLLLSVSSFGHSQHLVYIAVQPSSVTFLSPDTNITFQLKAYGTYIHPPETKDITGQVTWQSGSTDLVSVTTAGVISTANTGHCGVTDVIASMFTDSGNPKGNVVTTTITATVVDTTTPVCPQH